MDLGVSVMSSGERDQVFLSGQETHEADMVKCRLVGGGREAARVMSAAGESRSWVRPEGRRYCYLGEWSWGPLRKQCLGRLASPSLFHWHRARIGANGTSCTAGCCCLTLC